MNNQVQLITYVDRLVRGGLTELKEVLDTEFEGLFSGVHILPFYFPVDGSDAGFDPIDHTAVDPRLGTWEDISRIAKTMDVVADVIVNHISSKSESFTDYLKNDHASPYNGLLLTKTDVFPNPENDRDIGKIYRPRPGLPFTTYTMDNGRKVDLWTTFTPEQIDINVLHPQGRAYLTGILDKLSKAGIRLIRLDAVGYAIKKRGTSCFMLPETFDFIEELTTQARQRQMSVLVEVHAHYQQQIKIAEKVDLVYDFALPPLVLHAIFKRTGTYLFNWLKISPRNCITVLDTHDGIGIIDVGPSQGKQVKKGLLPPHEIADLLKNMHDRTHGQSERATGEGAKNLDLYQVNSTYYDVLGQNDDLYILARAIQFFCPGIPQVYYMGLLAEPNDVRLFEETGVGRDINRHYFDRASIRMALKRPVVRRLCKLIALRNTHPAFNGDFSLFHTVPENLCLRWTKELSRIELMINFKSLNYHIQPYRRRSVAESFHSEAVVIF